MLFAKFGLSGNWKDNASQISYFRCFIAENFSQRVQNLKYSYYFALQKPSEKCSKTILALQQRQRLPLEKLTLNSISQIISWIHKTCVCKYVCKYRNFASCLIGHVEIIFIWSFSIGETTLWLCFNVLIKCVLGNPSSVFKLSTIKAKFLPDLASKAIQYRVEVQSIIYSMESDHSLRSCHVKRSTFCSATWIVRELYYAHFWELGNRSCYEIFSTGQCPIKTLLIVSKLYYIGQSKIKDFLLWGLY